MKQWNVLIDGRLRITVSADDSDSAAKTALLVLMQTATRGHARCAVVPQRPFGEFTDADNN